MKQVVVILMVGVIVLTGNLIATAQTVDPSKVLAVVNGKEILQSDVDLVIAKFVIPQFQAQNPDKEFPQEEREKIVPSILDQLVTRTMLLQVAAKSDITPDETVINQQFEAIKAQQPTIADEDLRRFISDEIVIQQTIQQAVVSKISITDEEAQDYYTQNQDQFNEPEQIRASHILVKVAQDASQEDKDAAQKKIEEVLAKAKNGEDFAELAKQHSEGPSGPNGGDLGFFQRGAMVKPFEDAVLAMNEGDVSDLVETQFGYHIIKATGKKEPRTVSFEEVKDRLKSGLSREKTNTEVAKWIDDLKATAEIEIVE